MTCVHKHVKICRLPVQTTNSPLANTLATLTCSPCKAWICHTNISFFEQHWFMHIQVNKNNVHVSLSDSFTDSFFIQLYAQHGGIPLR